MQACASWWLPGSGRSESAGVTIRVWACTCTVTMHGAYVSVCVGGHMASVCTCGTVSV